VSGAGTFTGTCAVTVNASVYLPVYLFVSKTTAGTTDYWSQAYLFAYGDLGDNTAITMTKVQENGKDVILRTANTTNSNAMDNWQVWLAKIDITGKTISYSNTYFQVNNSTSGRWALAFKSPLLLARLCSLDITPLTLMLKPLILRPMSVLV
jgi:hypothetical protein